MICQRHHPLRSGQEATLSYEIHGRTNLGNITSRATRTDLSHFRKNANLIEDSSRLACKLSGHIQLYQTVYFQALFPDKFRDLLLICRSNSEWVRVVPHYVADQDQFAFTRAMYHSRWFPDEFTDEDTNA